MLQVGTGEGVAEVTVAETSEVLREVLLYCREGTPARINLGLELPWTLLIAVDKYEVSRAGFCFSLFQGLEQQIESNSRPATQIEFDFGHLIRRIE